MHHHPDLETFSGNLKCRSANQTDYQEVTWVHEGGPGVLVEKGAIEPRGHGDRVGFSCVGHLQTNCSKAKGREMVKKLKDHGEENYQEE